MSKLPFQYIPIPAYHVSIGNHPELCSQDTALGFYLKSARGEADRIMNKRKPKSIIESNTFLALRGSSFKSCHPNFLLLSFWAQGEALLAWMDTCVFWEKSWEVSALTYLKSPLEKYERAQNSIAEKNMTELKKS